MRGIDSVCVVFIAKIFGNNWKIGNCIISKIGEKFNSLYRVMLRKRLGVFNRVDILSLKGCDVSITMTTVGEFSIKNEIEDLGDFYKNRKILWLWKN